MNHPGEIAALTAFAARMWPLLQTSALRTFEFMGTGEAIAQEKSCLPQSVRGVRGDRCFECR